MNHYAAEQLTRQRYDQLAGEVRGDHLMRAALDADALAEASVVRSPTWHGGGLTKPIRERAFAVVPRLLSFIRVKTHRVIGTRHV